MLSDKLCREYSMQSESHLYHCDTISVKFGRLPINILQSEKNYPETDGFTTANKQPPYLGFWHTDRTIYWFALRSGSPSASSPVTSSKTILTSAIASHAISIVSRASPSVPQR